MGTFSILEKSLKIFKNKQRPQDTQWNSNFKEVHRLINEIIKDEPWIEYHENVFFQVIYLYDNIPSKTNRIMFRDSKNIRDIVDIPQKDISIQKMSNDLFKTIITYKITFEELVEFIKKIKFIYQNSYCLNETSFNLAKSDDKNLISQLSNVNKFSKIEATKIKKIKGKILVNFLPLFKDIAEFIKLETNLVIQYDPIIKGAYLTYEELELITAKVPWIIKDVVDIENLSIFLPNDLEQEYIQESIELKDPSRLTPIVGVIDSGCNLNGAFEKYIDGIHDYKEDGSISNFEHGSQVTSLIIANDELNPSCPDKMGNYKVRHFEVLGKSQLVEGTFCSFDHLTEKMVEIVSKNQDIRVWNLSLGCLKNPWSLTISKLGILIDYLASKYDCLFIISSGNEKQKCENELESLTFPADSLNALSVGSVELKPFAKKVTPSVYSSIGNISHFIKPEISSFGGPLNYDQSALKTFSGESLKLFSKGTSFSAPRITRIAAFLIKNQYSVLETKAKIINLATRETAMVKSSAFGYILPGIENFEFDLKLTTSLVDNKPRYVDINLTNVDKISISTCNFVNPHPAMGEEYSLSNVEIALIKYPTDWSEKTIIRKGEIKIANTPEELKRTATREENYETKYKKENIRRLEKGKYFSSHKVTYDLKKDMLETDWTYAIRLRRLDLYDSTFFNPLKIGLSILIMGEQINENDFIKNNELILDIDTDIEID